MEDFTFNEGSLLDRAKGLRELAAEHIKTAKHGLDSGLLTPEQATGATEAANRLLIEAEQLEKWAAEGRVPADMSDSPLWNNH